MKDHLQRDPSLEDRARQATADILQKYVYTEEMAKRICKTFYTIHSKSLKVPPRRYYR